MENTPAIRTSGPSEAGPQGLQLVVGERPLLHPLNATAPGTIDLQIIGRCQLRCEWCWGPQHHLGEMAPLQAWKRALNELAERGTESIVFTGGEPLLSPYVPTLLEHAHGLGLRTTLSTNGIILPRKVDVLRFVDDLGIPMDGHTPEVNAVMRKGSERAKGWEHAVAAIKIAQEHDVSVTVRTVVSQRNLASVPRIPAALRSQGIDITQIRFKFYEVEPLGPHFGSTDWATWAVDPAAVTAAAAAAAAGRRRESGQDLVRTAGRP